MTLDEIRKSDSLWLTPADVAEVLRADPQTIRIQARKDPAKLGFAVCIVGNRTKIHRKSFLRFIEGGC